MIYKPTPSKWSLPITASLLLHAAIIVLATHNLSSTRTSPGKPQAITVELLNQDNLNKPGLPQAKSRSVPKPLQEPLKPAPPTVTSNATAETIQSSPEQTEQIVTQASIPSATTSVNQASLNIQPLSKLSRPPSFLSKIEPIYPRAEQRAGSQAYVLAEVTIDEQGAIVEVKIVKSAGIAFDNAVKEALQRSTFVPGYMGQNAVAVRVMVPFRFNLK
jgi:protein TonB